MAYTDIISLANAKAYLGVDDTSRDTEITRIIGSALNMVEQQTGHIMEAQDRVYRYTDYKVRVYDYPINSTANTTAEVEIKHGYSLYEESDVDNETITINVGYEAVASIPAPLIEAGYQIIGALFNGVKIPDTAYQLMANYRRFTL